MYQYPQPQKGVVEQKNRSLIEAAYIMINQKNM